jgi:hypothetical protein
MNLTKGFQNIFSPTLTNFLIALSLVIIVFLVYIKTKKIDLFDADVDYLQSLIERIKKEQEQKNKFAISLATQEQTIQKLQDTASNIFSSI